MFIKQSSRNTLIQMQATMQKRALRACRSKGQPEVSHRPGGIWIPSAGGARRDHLPRVGTCSSAGGSSHRAGRMGLRAIDGLLTVYFGAGILTANSVFQFSQWQEGNTGGWKVSRQRYLSEVLFGYSLACSSWYRGDVETVWRKHLRDNIAHYFDDS